MYMRTKLRVKQNKLKVQVAANIKSFKGKERNLAKLNVKG